MTTRTLITVEQYDALPEKEGVKLVLKAQQYLTAGGRAVWIIYPEVRLAYVYKPGQRPEVRDSR